MHALHPTSPEAIKHGISLDRIQCSPASKATGGASPTFGRHLVRACDSLFDAAAAATAGFKKPSSPSQFVFEIAQLDLGGCFAHDSKSANDPTGVPNSGGAIQAACDLVNKRSQGDALSDGSSSDSDSDTYISPDTPPVIERAPLLGKRQHSSSTDDDDDLGGWRDKRMRMDLAFALRRSKCADRLRWRGRGGCRRRARTQEEQFTATLPAVDFRQTFFLFFLLPSPFCLLFQKSSSHCPRLQCLLSSIISALSIQLYWQLDGLNYFMKQYW